jgi:hypothetical protein
MVVEIAMLICFEDFVKDGMLRSSVVPDEAIGRQWWISHQTKTALACKKRGSAGWT